MTLKTKFESIVQEYVDAFEKKHDLDTCDWVADKVGEIGLFNDYYFDFRDIRYDIDNNIPETKLIEWYDRTLDSALKNELVINFENYCKL